MGKLRNVGIDALRLYSMLMIIIIHIISYNDLDTLRGMHGVFAWILYIFVYCAVNCYGLISGYVAYTDQEKQFKYYKYINMWIQVFTYSFGFTLLSYIFKRDTISTKDLIMSLFPVTSEAYWYFTAYTALFFMSPFLIKFVRGISEEDFKKFLIVFGVLFSVYASLAGIITDPFYLVWGFSFLWLVLLFIVGAGIKKFDLFKNIKNKFFIYILLSCVFVTLICKLSIQWITEKIIGHSLGERLLFEYMSPTMICMAVCYLMLFSRMKINGIPQKIITFLAPAAFGVYLIHEHNVIKKVFIRDNFTWICDLPFFVLPFVVIGIAIGILILCLIIDLIRLYLFNKIKKIFLFLKGRVGIKR